MNVPNTRIYWIVGTLTAFAGVAIARLLAPLLQPSAFSKAVIVFGHLLALSGLVGIMMGTRKKHRAMMSENGDQNDKT